MCTLKKLDNKLCQTIVEHKEKYYYVCCSITLEKRLLLLQLGSSWRDNLQSASLTYVLLINTANKVRNN